MSLSFDSETQLRGILKHACILDSTYNFFRHVIIFKIGKNKVILMDNDKYIRGRIHINATKWGPTLNYQYFTHKTTRLAFLVKIPSLLYFIPRRASKSKLKSAEQRIGPWLYKVQGDLAVGVTFISSFSYFNGLHNEKNICILGKLLILLLLLFLL